MILNFLRPLFWRAQFPERTLPWTDRSDFEKQLARRLAEEKVSRELAAELCTWQRDGFLLWRRAVEPALLDELLEDYETAWQERPVCHLLFSDRGRVTWEQAGARGRSRHFRVMDFHNLSDAAAEVMMQPRIINFLRVLFEDIPVGMQTLFFEYGSEQDLHQDFAYVHAGVLSHLAASWIACEDADESNGPLVYYPGSHRIPKFDFGGGRIAYDYKNAGRIPVFTRYLKDACEREGLEPRTLHVQKGDVLLWHAALVHGGRPVRDPARTRKSLVSHYSHLSAYPQERRLPGRVPRRREFHGGIFYEWEAPGHQEARYPRKGVSTVRGNRDD